MFNITDNRINNLKPILSNISAYQWSEKWDEFPGIPIEFEIASCFKSRIDLILGFMQNQWYYSFYISLVYVGVIFSLQNHMKNRKPFSLRTPLFLWNALLAIFSIVGTIRCWPEFIDILSKQGIYGSFCNSSYFYDLRLVVWYWYFVMSKAFELGDTIFVVLRKQKLYHLHWIHHVVTLCFCWFVFSGVPGTARWMVNMNFAVHSVMYTYYALRSLKVQIPRQIAMSITVGQIVQMLFGFYINIKSFQYKVNGVACDMSLSVASTGLGIYSLFFILFINYFVKSYFASIFGGKANRKQLLELNNNVFKKIQ